MYLEDRPSEAEATSHAARIKWWLMKENEAAVISHIWLLAVITVDEAWKKATDALRQAAMLDPSITKPGRHRVDQKTWLWTDEIKVKAPGTKSRVQAAAGASVEFPISVGVHQGSALSPLLFVVVMDAITRDLQQPVPWTLLFAEDMMLACEDKDDLERQVQAWCDRLAMRGLKLNARKADYLTSA
ncbi:unnamed protein product [Heligmosomoides polygyrus]|uniref:Reverse transcriptase domain-containing protein n=1 Tax=Heligmosomoides polygyrus TaxID=6339 RepID=A0A183F405_HELPZ|nr:unnamed protein product [Heligmosomoides polygyrus]